MGFVIERCDGTAEGLGDHVVFATVAEACAAAGNIGLSDYVVEPTDEEPMTDGKGMVIR
jgi:hypothetical protein